MEVYLHTKGAFQTPGIGLHYSKTYDTGSLLYVKDKLGSKIGIDHFNITDI